MTVQQIATRTLTHWKVVLLVFGLGLTGSLAASGLGHLFEQIKIRQVVLDGSLNYLDQPALEAQLTRQFSGSYLETALPQVVSAVEAHPWIADAAVRRVWPDTLLVEITEQRPVAIYNDTLYLGVSGDLFEPPKPVNEPLPRLYGARSETMQVYSHYGVFADRLADIAEVDAVSRGVDLGWQITLDTGVLLKLGRTDILGRLARARDVLLHLDADTRANVRGVDARYGNGVALNMEDPE
jgi:cell division protein FtsQ